MTGITHNDVCADRYVGAFKRRSLERGDIKKNPKRVIWDLSGRGETRTHDLTDVNPVGIDRYNSKKTNYLRSFLEPHSGNVFLY